jgi:hypothetical protein
MENTNSIIKTLREKMVKNYIDKVTSKDYMKKVLAVAESQGRQLPEAIKKFIEDNIKEE